MGWSEKRKAELSDDLDILLGDLCTKWGFCNQLDGDDLIASHKELTPDTFADAVLEAEGMKPEYELEWRRKIQSKFVERYGSSVSEKTYTI